MQVEKISSPRTENPFQQDCRFYPKVCCCTLTQWAEVSSIGSVSKMFAEFVKGTFTFLKKNVKPKYIFFVPPSIKYL